MAIKTSVDIGGVTIKNPVMTASGTFGYGEEFAPYTDLRALGAVVVKGLSLKPRPGNPTPRTVETPSGMLNAIGLQNVGVEPFIEEKLPYLRDIGVPAIANIFGESVDEYRAVAERLEGCKGIAAIEINISCPNVKKGGLQFGTDPNSARTVVEAVKAVTSLPVMTKLSPNVTDIRAMALAVEDGGTDSISLINTITGMVVDIDKRRPVLANGVGGLSGPAIRPVAVRMVCEVASVVRVPVIGMGGIMNGDDALQFIIAGATAVQVGTASFIDPDSAAKVVSGIESYMKKYNIEDINELVGSIKLD